ncbi:hypothetical protein AGIG_G20968 [Arapaima gigas]
MRDCLRLFKTHTGVEKSCLFLGRLWNSGRYNLRSSLLPVPVKNLQTEPGSTDRLLSGVYRTWKQQK